MENIIKAASLLKNADAILIGASNGLSISEGYHIFANNEMFQFQFSDYQKKFGIKNVVQGCFYPYPDENDHTVFFDRLIKYWIDDYAPSDVMKNLLNIISEKDYFILTSNGDTHLQLSGFDDEKIFEIEGNFKNAFKEVIDKTDALNHFLKKYSEKKLVILELGIGSRNTMIKQPLMNFAEQTEKVKYITLNLEHELFIPNAIKHKSIGLSGNIASTLHQLNNLMKK